MDGVSRNGFGVPGLSYTVYSQVRPMRCSDERTKTLTELEGEDWGFPARRCQAACDGDVAQAPLA